MHRGHAPNDHFIVKSFNPKAQGLAGSTIGSVDLLYRTAAIA
jgi:hypothetical protein